MQHLLNEIDYKCPTAPDEDTFALWRAVLALVHVDDEVDELEQYLVDSVTQIFKFTPDQIAQIQSDIQSQTSPQEFFKSIKEQRHRAQFFRLARVIIWCDGILHDEEMKIVEGIKTTLGDEVEQYESELRWMHRKPDLPFGEETSIPEEAMIKQIIIQMIAFYEEQ